MNFWASTPTNIHDPEAAQELLEDAQGWALGDRNYWKPEWQLALRQHGLVLLAPYKSAKRQKFHYPHWLTEKRYRIETVFGQIVERFYAKKVWARDVWHLTVRWLRKLVSHLIAVLSASRSLTTSIFRVAEGLNLHIGLTTEKTAYMAVEFAR